MTFREGLACAFQPYWGKPAVRNDRGDRGNVGIIRSPIRASILPDHSRHEPLAEFGDAKLVRTAAARAAGFVARNLQSCRDASFRDEPLLALLIVMACSSLLQTALADQTQSLNVEALHAHMRAMVLGYLREAQQLEPGQATGRSD